MNTLILGNIVSGIGCLLMVGIGLIRKKSHILAAQCVQFGFMGLGNLILGGTAGMVSNLVGIARNLAFAKFSVTLGLKLLFIAIQAALSLPSLGGGLIHWLPLVSASIFTWFLDTKSEALLKTVIFFTMIMWLIYDLYFLNYTAAAFDAMTMVSNLIGFFLVRKQK